MGITQEPYLIELKTVSAILSEQKTWQPYPYKDIFKTIALFSFGYMFYLDDYIREQARYGCPVREEAFKEFAINKMMSEDDRMRESERQLAENILILREKPDKFSIQEKDCYKRVRLLAEARANRNTVELYILDQTPYDPKTDFLFDNNIVPVYLKKKNSEIVDIVNVPRVLQRPEKLKYVDGVTEDTQELYSILQNYRQTQQQKRYPS